MRINEYQLAVVAQRVASLVEPMFFEMPEDEQQQQVQQTSTWLLPVLQSLPEGVRPETLNEHSASIFSCAENLLLEAHRHNPGYRTISDDKIRANLDSDKIQQVAINLFKFAQVALENLPAEVTLDQIAENFAFIDLDAEFLRLMESDR